MGQQTTTQNSTTQTGVPNWQQPYLERGLQYSQNLLNVGAPQQYPGSTVTPYSQPTEQAFQAIQQRALNGSPAVNAAQNYITNGLQNPQSNPYLDKMFQQAADATRGQLTSEYARAGRNVNASAPVRADQLNNLATSIYGNAYNTDVASRNQMLGQVLPLANQQYTDYAQLRGVGSAMEDLTSRYQQDAANRWNYEQAAPGVALDDYIRRITGQMQGQTSTTSTPITRSVGAGALGGAAAGAGLGSSLNLGGNSNAWLTALGGILGAFG